MFTVSVGATPDSFDRVVAFVRTRAEHFGRAFALGFFAPATLAAPIAVRPLSTRIEIDIQATCCPPGVLRILWGMCEWGRLIERLPLEWLGVSQDRVPLQLSATPLPPLGGSGEHTFRLERPAFIGFGEQVVLLAESAKPLDKKQVELLDAGFHTWAALMQGGFPPEGNAPGESGIGATSGHLIMPTTYQWFVESLAADMGGIDLLVKFLDVQAAPLALKTVGIES